MENQYGLLVEAQASQPTATAEREADIEQLNALCESCRITFDVDNNYDIHSFVEALHARNVKPYVAQNTAKRRSSFYSSMTHHAGSRTSLTARKRIDEYCTWLTTIADLRKSRLVEREKLDFQFMLSAASYDLLRKRNLCVEGGGAWHVEVGAKGLACALN